MSSAYLSVAIMEENSSANASSITPPPSSNSSGNLTVHSSLTTANIASLPRMAPKTSISHPINISWILPSEYLPLLSYCELPDEIDLYDLTDPVLEHRLAPHLAEAQKAVAANCSVVHGNLALSSCPGKKVRLTGPSRGRAAIDRELDMDFSRMQSFGITTVVCCLNDAELDYLGASWPKYSEAAAQAGMDVIRVPMIEGSCPDTLEEIDAAIDAVNAKIHRGENVLTHCRGGVGRAGLFACCWLLKNLYCLSAERAIRYVRIRRSPKAIETMRQAEYVIRYSQYVGKILEQPQLLRPIPIGGEVSTTIIHSTTNTPTKNSSITTTTTSSTLSKPLLMHHTDFRLRIPSLSDISRLEQSMRDPDRDKDILS